MMGELGFFEIGVEDVERGRAFYEGLFGWHFEPGPSGKGYSIVTPTVGGGMHGGDAGAAPYVFFDVEDIDAAVERVRTLGGEVADVGIEGGEESVAKFGRFKLCRDDQGSTVRPARAAARLNGADRSPGRARDRGALARARRPRHATDARDRAGRRPRAAGVSRRWRRRSRDRAAPPTRRPTARRRRPRRLRRRRLRRADRASERGVGPQFSEDAHRRAARRRRASPRLGGRGGRGATTQRRAPPLRARSPRRRRTS